jgi:hypothetical protein
VKRTPGQHRAGPFQFNDTLPIRCLSDSMSFAELGRHLDLGGGGGGAFEGDLGGRPSAQQRFEAEGQLDCVESQRLHSLHLSAEVRTHTAGPLCSTHSPFIRAGQVNFF